MSKEPPLGLLFALAALCAVCSSSSAAAGWFTFMGDSGSVGPGSLGPGSLGPGSVIIDHCKGLSNTSPASNVSVACLRQTLKNVGCVKSGSLYKSLTDDYNGWWRQSPQGTTTVYCDNQGTPCGAGTFGVIKTDMNIYGTATSGDRYIRCKGGATPIQLTDGVAHAYNSANTYVCTSGKDIGCANYDTSGAIMHESGVYSNGTCPNPSEFVYCMNPRTVTMAQYSDNADAGTGAWDVTMHRFAAEGKRCPTATAGKCQDDQSIAASGTGNTRKITASVTSRQCVDNSFVYC